MVLLLELHSCLSDSISRYSYEYSEATGAQTATDSLIYGSVHITEILTSEQPSPRQLPLNQFCRQVNFALSHCYLQSLSTLANYFVSYSHWFSCNSLPLLRCEHTQRRPTTGWKVHCGTPSNSLWFQGRSVAQAWPLISLCGWLRCQRMTSISLRLFACQTKNPAFKVCFLAYAERKLETGISKFGVDLAASALGDAIGTKLYLLHTLDSYFNNWTRSNPLRILSRTTRSQKFRQ
jgi:hypothetical protein